MTPTWVNDAVAAFGRQMGLKDFVLNERGTAGVDFENGVALRLEYATEALIVRAGVKAGDDPRTVVRALQAAHPLAQTGVFRIRAVRFVHTGETAFLTRIPAREVNVTAIEAAFRRVFEEALRLGRAA